MNRMEKLTLLALACALSAGCGGGGGGGSSPVAPPPPVSPPPPPPPPPPPASCTNCTSTNTEVRQLAVGDRYNYSLTEVELPTQSTTNSTQEWNVVAGPTYSLNQKSVQTFRIVTQTTSSSGTTVINSDVTQTGSDRRIRLVADDGFVINATAFESDNFPVYIPSPLGVGLSYAYEVVFFNSTNNNVARRFTLNASVVGIEQVQTPAATFRAYKITYQRTCRQNGTFGYTNACRNSFLNESGNLWVYPNVGIVQQSGTAEYGASAFTDQVSRRFNFTLRLTSTNFLYN